MPRHANPARSAKSDPESELGPRGKTLLQERLRTYGLFAMFVAAGYFPAFYLTWLDHPGVTREALLAHVLSPWPFALFGIHASSFFVGRAGPLPGSWLRAFDVAYSLVVGVVFGRVLTTHPAPAIAPVEGVLAVTTVLGLRALVVPSTGKRTALAGVLLAAGPLTTILGNSEHFSANYLGVRTSAPLFAIWATMGIALTSVASEVLYGLRREVRDARRLGQYTLVERLGAGGMGEVFRAEHALLRRPTAVKLLPPNGRLDSVARFEREVQLMAELTHPNTVAVYDYGRTERGVFYYAMEYLDGVDLQGLVEVGGPQPPARVIHLLRQICGSLEEAHERGLIHRDIKPANVFLCRKRSEPDTVKVLDFGLAKQVLAEEASQSSADMILGTPLYMPPEALTGTSALDARSDLYSLGALAYLLLAGTPVFSAGTAIEVFAKHLHATPEAPSARLGRALPADLEAIVLSCLSKVPDRRPASARELRSALDDCDDAGRWSRSDADAWWGTYGARVDARRVRTPPSSGSSNTVVVDVTRSHGMTISE
ncbi:MAG TPA: serine/threonine-protein kinase [Polyangiaceae bacterium]